MALALQRLLGRLRSPSISASVANPFVYSGHGLRYKRKLEVILTTNIDKLGKAGEMVKVAPGHFRNHLMPKLLAVPNIDKYAFLIREQRKLYNREEVEAAELLERKETIEKPLEDKKMEDKLKEYQAAARRLDNARLVLRRLVKGDNELREPVTKEVLVSEVARQLCVNIYPDNLHLPAPLTTVGEYEVPLRLPRQVGRPEGKVQWTLKVKIRCK